MKKSVRVLLIILCCILLTVFVVCAYKIASTLIGYKKAESSYNNISSQVVKMASPKPAVQTLPDTPEASAPPEHSPLKIDFDSLRADYPEVVGWIYSPNTKINYPVVHTTDNVFYIEHLYNGDYNMNGSIFVDCKCAGNFTEQNTLVYGHNMNDGSMFAGLRDYRDPNFYPEHPVMYLSTPDKDYRIDLFAGFVTAADSDAYTFIFEHDDQFNDFLASAAAQSTFHTDVKVSAEDRIVTLSTCTYEFDNARYVVMGKLVEILPYEE